MEILGSMVIISIIIFVVIKAIKFAVFVVIKAIKFAVSPKNSYKSIDQKPNSQLRESKHRLSELNKNLDKLYDELEAHYENLDPIIKMDILSEKINELEKESQSNEAKFDYLQKELDILEIQSNIATTDYDLHLIESKFDAIKSQLDIVLYERNNIQRELDIITRQVNKFTTEQKIREQQDREQRDREKTTEEQQEREPECEQDETNIYKDTYLQMNWYRILGVSSNASTEEIICAYRKLRSEYHPDKVDKMGDKIRELAKIESQKINAAFVYAHKQGLV